MQPSRDFVHLGRLVHFATVVDLGSFTQAAGRLGVTKAVVSHHVARLEEELGVTLLIRTTRKVTPTEAGRALHARCSVILEESALALAELEAGAAEPRGALRVTAPVDYGTSMVLPIAAKFSTIYPACSVELRLGDQQIDVSTIDLAVRVGELRDSNYLSRRIGRMEQLLVGARELIGRIPRPSSPADLEELPFVANASLPKPTEWQFTHATRGRRIARFRPRLTVDSAPAALSSVLAGAGISVLPDYSVAEALRQKRISVLLPNWKLKSGGIYLLFPSSRFRPAKTTRFAELLIQSESERQGRLK